MVIMVAGKLKSRWLCIVYLLIALDNQRGSFPGTVTGHASCDVIVDRRGRGVPDQNKFFVLRMFKIPASAWTCRRYILVLSVEMTGKWQKCSIFVL